MDETKFEDSSKEAQDGMKLFQKWIKKIPVHDLVDDDDTGFVLTNECTSEHNDSGNDFWDDSRWDGEGGSEEMEYYECCRHDLSDMVVCLCIYSGASIKEAHKAASYAFIQKNFWRDDVQHTWYPD